MFPPAAAPNSSERPEAEGGKEGRGRMIIAEQGERFSRNCLLTKRRRLFRHSDECRRHRRLASPFLAFYSDAGPRGIWLTTTAALHFSPKTTRPKRSPCCLGGRRFDGSIQSMPLAISTPSARRDARYIVRETCDEFRLKVSKVMGNLNWR